MVSGIRQPIHGACAKSRQLQSATAVVLGKVTFIRAVASAFWRPGSGRCRMAAHGLGRVKTQWVRTFCSGTCTKRPLELPKYIRTAHTCPISRARETLADVFTQPRSGSDLRPIGGSEGRRPAKSGDSVRRIARRKADTRNAPLSAGPPALGVVAERPTSAPYKTVLWRALGVPWAPRCVPNLLC